VIVHETGEYENHWTIFLIIGPARSVRINMGAEPGYTTGDLKISDKYYIRTLGICGIADANSGL
jgi:hypothetical protein